VSSIKESHLLSEAIYDGVLEKHPWITLLKYLEEYFQLTSATMVIRCWIAANTDPSFALNFGPCSFG